MGTSLTFALIRTNLRTLSSTITPVRQRSSGRRTRSTHLLSGGPVISARGRVRSRIGAGHVLLLVGRLVQI
uniref:Uncharacterized protein n=1 Tax=Arundo donax TaxID=35708 RepID=A0A0A9G6J3_ARUDO